MTAMLETYARPAAALPHRPGDLWLPDLSRFRGPRYKAIADALAEDIEQNRLPSGTRLPTHRELAYRLKVTVGTVTRAYSEAEKRGLIGGEVGRGTFVRPRLEQVAATALTNSDTLIDLAINVSGNNCGSEARCLSETLAEIAQGGAVEPFLAYQPHLGMADHRAAMARFLSRPEFEPLPESVFLTSGAQHALLMALSAVAAPGDTIACDALTYGGLKSAARLMHLRLKGLPGDAEGILPDAFDAACREGLVKALYCMPTLQNPTAIIWSAARRAEIAEIAQRYRVAILEDDVYGFLVPEAPLPLRSYAPDQVYYLNSTSKSLAAGLRIGALVAPPEAATRIATGVRTTVWMAPPLMAEIVRRWVDSGTAQRLIAEKRLEAAARQAIARRVLGGYGLSPRPTHPSSYHLWLDLPEGWRDDVLIAAARRDGVILSPTAAFCVGRTVSDGLRLALGTPRGREDIERGFHVLGRLLGGTGRAEEAALEESVI